MNRRLKKSKICPSQTYMETIRRANFFELTVRSSIHVDQQILPLAPKERFLDHQQHLSAPIIDLLDAAVRTLYSTIDIGECTRKPGSRTVATLL